jgi:hypothetical protein
VVLGRIASGLFAVIVHFLFGEGERGGSMDRTTKFLLGLIVILLAAHLFKPLFVPTTAVARVDFENINIARIGGVAVDNGVIKVYISGSRFADIQEEQRQFAKR